MANCEACIFVGDIKLICSIVQHDGQHLAIGMSHAKQPTPEPLMAREKRIAYRVAWSDDPTATLEV